LFGKAVFSYPKSLYTLIDCINAGFNNKNSGIVLDYFAGSGSTGHAILDINKNNKDKKIQYLLIEVENYFYTALLPRMKKIIWSDNWEKGVSKDGKCISQFFKYYELEQYEEALANCKYNDNDLFNKTSEKTYQDYVFMKDDKMLKSLEIDYKNNKAKVDLSKLYPDIDIAETLSNLTGRWIKAIKDDEVEFADGSKINTKELDYKLIKPLIWWE